tara:strand:+ start:248 stop:394 length:147 start_codon:yes stop_codon:yes gene_type:complete
MSGEKKGTREAMDRMVRQLVNNGTDRNYAKEKAREAAIKNERKTKAER